MHYISWLSKHLIIYIINETNFGLCIQDKLSNKIKGIYSKRTGKLSKLLLFKEIYNDILIGNTIENSFVILDYNMNQR